MSSVEKEIKTFDLDRFEATVEDLIENSQYRIKVVLASNTEPRDVINGLIYDCKSTLRLLEVMKIKYKL